MTPPIEKESKLQWNDKAQEWQSWPPGATTVMPLPPAADKVTIVKEKFYPADKELIEQLQAENARLREAFDLTIDRSFWLLEKGSPAQWITHSEDYLKLIKQLGVDAPYIKSFDERSGIGMNKAWDFTGDAQKAIKFDSKEKADYFAKEERLFEHGVVAIGHVFMEMPATNEEKLNHIAKALATTPSTWLAEHDVEVRQKVLEEIDSRYYAAEGKLSLAIIITAMQDELRRMAASPKVETDSLQNPAGKY